jgi:leucyl aminopeptidase
MEVTVAARGALAEPADLLALALVRVDPARWRLPARAAEADRGLGGRVSAALASGDFRGRRGESLVVYPEPGGTVRRVLLVGLGEEGALDGDVLREAAALAVRAGAERGAGRVAFLAAGLRRPRAPALAQALAEGALLGGYRFDRYQQPRPDEPRGRVARFVVLLERGSDLRAARAAAGAGVHVAESQNLARDLSNEPPNALPPAALARAAERVARETGLRVRVLEPPELRRRKLGALLAVGGGSRNGPRLIVLEHNAPRGRAAARRRRTLCLVGKGVTFDSGGLSLKPSTSMVKMKHDMSGGAAVIGALRAAALLRLPLHVVGLVGAVENLPSGTAYRPDDILTSGSGQTIEITNTDAEGRLVLADVLHFARSEYRPDAIVDLATLTGACSVALGNWAAAVLGNDERLSELVIECGKASGERYWPLPLWDVHKEHMRSRIADVKQTAGREGGTITAAAFLSYFAGEQPWAHLDIAPVADTEQATPLQPPGATGFGVRTLVELLRRFPGARLGEKLPQRD